MARYRDADGAEINIGDTIELLGPDGSGSFRCGFNGYMEKLVGNTMTVDTIYEGSSGGVIHVVSTASGRAHWNWPVERVIVINNDPPKVSEEDFNSVFA